mmetsp:Transcript_71983/g.204259  ORF Transcript_71983/g.204259 Transcript_71983/m.204259 type:complete len:748 (+) Transcript_71983:92-2335(+)
MAAGTARSPGLSRINSEIRFTDVAAYVGMSLSRDVSLRSPAKPKSRLSPRDYEREPGLSPASKTQPPAETGKECDLPPIHAGRAERMRCQLEWLRAEQRAEREQVHKLEASLSDSLLLEKKAQRRAAKHKEMRDFHQQRAADVELKISKLREELETRSRPSREKAEDVSRASMGSAGSAGSPRPGRAGAGAGAVEGEKAAPPTAQPGAPSKQAKRTPVPGPGLEEEAAARATEERRAMSAGEFSAGAERLQASGIFSGTAGSSRGFEQEAGGYWAQRGAQRGDADLAGRASASELSDDHDASGRAASAAPASRQRSAPASPVGGSLWLDGASDSQLLSHNLVRFGEQQSQDTIEAAEARREAVRKELLRSKGTEREAFKGLDLNGSGNISLQEFADGVARAGVDWTALTGLKRPRELFKLFDQDKDGVITFHELFPELEPREVRRPTTPEFVNLWIRRNRDFDKLLAHPRDQYQPRCPKWQPSSPDDKLQKMLEAAQFRDEVDRKKKWMSSTIRRLKTRGKSDARCREIVALHLPRGSGPKDREDVPIFSQKEVRDCKKAYTDAYMEPVKRIQKVVIDLKEQKRDVRSVREELFLVTEAKLMQQKAEEERKTVASSIAGHSGLSILAKVRDPLQADEEGGKGKGHLSLRKISEENGMDNDAVSDLYRDFLKFADSNELLGRKGFSRLLQALSPNRTMPDSDLEAWWTQVTKNQQAGDAPPGSPGARRNQCEFEEFAVWFASSEARTT